MASVWLDERDLRWSPGFTERTLLVRRRRRRSRGTGFALLALLLAAAAAAVLALPGHRDPTGRLIPLSAVMAAAPPAERALLHRIALCESGGDAHAIYDDGRYRGAFQFDESTWRSVGGHGDPARAPLATQRVLALRLLHARGSAPWPVCGQR